MSVFIGIDGGGTGCRAIVCDAGGNHLGYGKSGPANIMTDFNGARANIIEASQLAIADAKMVPDKISEAKVYLGLAGANIGDYARRMSAALPFYQCHIDTDAMLSLHGAIGNCEGVVAVIGTGSVFVYRHDGIVRTAGGWGFMVGDLGSGSRLGRALLQQTLLSFDGIIKGSQLTAHILSQFENNPQTIVEYAHTARPGEFGKFAPLIFDFAQRDDPIARDIIANAVDDIEQTLDVIVTGKNHKLCMLGGLGEKYIDLIDQRFAALVTKPLNDAAGGAASLAAQFFSQHKAEPKNCGGRH